MQNEKSLALSRWAVPWAKGCIKGKIEYGFTCFKEELWEKFELSGNWHFHIFLIHKTNQNLEIRKDVEDRLIGSFICNIEMRSSTLVPTPPYNWKGGLSL